MFEFIEDLCESKLFPTYSHLKGYKPETLAEIIYLYFCAINILFHEDSSKEFIKDNCRKTIQYNNFDLKRNNASDLYVLIHALLKHDDVKYPKSEEKYFDKFDFDTNNAIQYMKNVAYDHEQRGLDRKFFLGLDRKLLIDDTSYKMVRRLSMDWSTIELSDKKRCMTRLLQFLKIKALNSELMPYLNSIKFHEDDEEEKPEKHTFLKLLKDHK